MLPHDGLRDLTSEGSRERLARILSLVSPPNNAPIGMFTGGAGNFEHLLGGFHGPALWHTPGEGIGLYDTGLSFLSYSNFFNCSLKYVSFGLPSLCLNVFFFFLFFFSGPFQSHSIILFLTWISFKFFCSNVFGQRLLKPFVLNAIVILGFSLMRRKHTREISIYKEVKSPVVRSIKNCFRYIALKDVVFVWTSGSGLLQFLFTELSPEKGLMSQY